MSGEFIYNVKENVHSKLPPGPRGDRMKEFVPEFVDVSTRLLVNTEASLYSNIIDTIQPDLSQEDDRMARMKKRLAPANDIVFMDIENGLVVQKKEFMDKVFLIKDSIGLSNWKVTGEMKEVGGLNCMEAVFIPKEDDTTAVTAWFAPEIATNAGPAGFGGLPGLVVYLNINNGQTVISLVSQIMREVKSKEIDIPSKGKVVTQEEYDDLVKKKMEQMKKQMEGRGGPGGGPPRH